MTAFDWNDGRLLTLQPGDWSLIGYSGSSPEPLATALGHLNNAVDIVYGFAASQGGALSYFSTAGMSQFNTLHALAPAQGYWVHLTGTPPQTWSGQ